MASDSRLQVAIWTVKLALYSIGMISTAVFLKHAIAYFLGSAVYTMPSVWSSLRSWLSPLYLYIVVNFIILFIAASSNFHHKLSEENAQAKAEKVPEKQKDSVDPAPEVTAFDNIPTDSDDKQPEIFSVVPDSVISSAKPSTARARRSVRASASSKSLGASKPKLPDTLDDTWKAITEGRGNRQLKKSDTWEVGPRVEPSREETGLLAAGRDLKNWETFKEAAAASASWVGGLRREISLSKEEVNRRVEAFIRKINNEIRLQRQQSHEKSLELAST